MVLEHFQQLEHTEERVPDSGPVDRARPLAVRRTSGRSRVEVERSAAALLTGPWFLVNADSAVLSQCATLGFTLVFALWLVPPADLARRRLGCRTAAAR